MNEVYYVFRTTLQSLIYGAGNIVTSGILTLCMLTSTAAIEPFIITETLKVYSTNAAMHRLI